MTQPQSIAAPTLAVVPTQLELRQMQTELYRLSTERVAALTASAGTRALAYVLKPADTASQQAALDDQHLMDGIAVAKQCFESEVQYYDGDGLALVTRCANRFDSLAKYDHKCAEEAALKVVHLDTDSAGYRKANMAVTQLLHHEMGIREFAEMYRTAFGKFLPQTVDGAQAAA